MVDFFVLVFFFAFQINFLLNLLEVFQLGDVVLRNNARNFLALFALELAFRKNSHHLVCQLLDDEVIANKLIGITDIGCVIDVVVGGN